jgi:hypothetical protein
MGTFVLVYFFISSPAFAKQAETPHIVMQEFNSKESCENAAKEIKNMVVKTSATLAFRGQETLCLAK